MKLLVLVYHSVKVICIKFSYLETKGIPYLNELKEAKLKINEELQLIEDKAEIKEIKYDHNIVTAYQLYKQWENEDSKSSQVFFCS